MVLESGLLQEQDDHYVLTGALPDAAIPTTLHDSLLARLDHLAAAGTGATRGDAGARLFPELLRAVSPWGDATLQQGCASWWQRSCSTSVDCRHRPYLFKHALIQDAAYQSLLHSTRRQYHQQIARCWKPG